MFEARAQRKTHLWVDILFSVLAKFEYIQTSNHKGGINSEHGGSAFLYVNTLSAKRYVKSLQE